MSGVGRLGVSHGQAPPSIPRGFLAISQSPSLSLGAPSIPQNEKDRGPVRKSCGKGQAGLTGQGVECVRGVKSERSGGVAGVWLGVWLGGPSRHQKATASFFLQRISAGFRNPEEGEWEAPKVSRPPAFTLPSVLEP